MTEISASSITVADHRKIAFLSTLFFLTVGTVVLYPLFNEFVSVPENRGLFIFLALGWLSTAHVATTAFFYADKEFLPHALSRPGRYIWAPLGVFVASVAAWGLTYKTVGHWYPWQIYHGWLLYHYMRQNIGVTALAAQASSENRLTDLERKVITATSVAGILGAMRFGPEGPLSAAHETMIANMGLAVYTVTVMAALYCIWLRLSANPRAWVTPAFLAAVTAFFAPTFFFDSYFVAVLSYAVAHALQYWFLISLVAIGSGKTSGYVRSVGSLVGLTVGIWVLIYLSRQPDLWPGYVGWVAGIGIGITVAHFVIDADAWRLREKFQRTYIMSRLAPFMGRGA
jgi:hypothetical protein